MPVLKKLLCKKSKSLFLKSRYYRSILLLSILSKTVNPCQKICSSFIILYLIKAYQSIYSINNLHRIFPVKKTGLVIQIIFISLKKHVFFITVLRGLYSLLLLTYYHLSIKLPILIQYPHSFVRENIM